MSDEALDAHLDWLDKCAKEQGDIYDALLEKTIAQLETEIAKLKRGIRDAMNNLGVPNEGYPSPVAEAWAILAALLTEEQEDE